MKRLIVVFLVLTISTGAALAERTWAPGIKRNRSDGPGNLFPTLSARFGISLTSTDMIKFEAAEIPKDVSLLGASLDIGITPFRTPISPEVELTFEIPLAFSVLQGKAGFGDWRYTEFGMVTGDKTSLEVLGRIIPTARVIYTMKSGMQVASNIGFGLGSNIGIFNKFADDFQLVTAFRIGGDLMLSKSFGFGLNYTLNSLDGIRYFPYVWTDDNLETHTSYNPVEEKIHLNELGITMIARL